MIFISPTELRSQQEKPFDLAEKERTITDADLMEGISAEEVKRQVYEHIDKLFSE